MNYGIPYQGSKNRIAKEIIELLPKGKRFVDLFAGGCAITHAAMLSWKYESFLVNDLYPVGARMFKKALEGEYTKPEYFRWVSREEFFDKKDTDDFIKLCYSFGNNGSSYMYSKKIEPLKKAFHYVVVYDDWTYLEEYAKEHNWKYGLIDEMKKSVDGIDNQNQRRSSISKLVQEHDDIGIKPPLLQHLGRLGRMEEINQRRKSVSKIVHVNSDVGIQSSLLENIECMNRLNISTSNSNIDFTSFDYREYQHEDGDIVYCDPPYKGTKGYDDREFDHEAFYEWCRQ